MRGFRWLLVALLLAQDWTPMGRRPVDLRLHGYWQGTINLTGDTHDVTLRFSPRLRPAVTLARRRLDGLLPLRATQLSHSETSLQATFARPAFSLSAALRPDNQSLDVVVIENGIRQTAIFKRADAPGGLRRPQTPRPPFPYDTFDDIIDTGNGLLGATLTLPKGRGPFPGIVLLSGTGAQDRDNEAAGHRMFAVLADHLTRRGFGVLRFDDRGAGVSSGLGGRFRTIEGDAADASAAMRFLRAHPTIHRPRTGFIGYSEGGIQAPLAARQFGDLAFLVLLGAPATNMVDLALLQHEMIERARGASEERIAFERRVRTRIYDIMRDETDPARARDLIAVVFREATIEAGTSDLPWIIQLKAAVDSLMRARSSEGFRQRMLADPAPALRALRVPVLALFAGLDVQVPAAANEPLMRESLSASSPLTEVRILAGLNHAFQTAQTGSVDEYGKIEETFAPAALDAIGAWLARVTAK